MKVTPLERVKLFWQPGCSSCLRTKEFLTNRGIEFESINVHGNPDGMAQLQALGVRSVPVVSIGDTYTFCQSFDDVIHFLQLDIELSPPLPPDQLVSKIDLILTATARYIRQIPIDKLRQPFRDRDRSAADLAFHIIRVAEMGLRTARKIELKSEDFAGRPPQEWGAEEIAQWGLAIRDEIREWWQNEPDPTLQFMVRTYYGERMMHNVLERTAWHTGQHARQLMLMLEDYQVQVDGPLSSADLEGLPLPENVWDN